MSVFVRYPDDWIGVPPCGPLEEYSTPRVWAQALVDEVVEIARVKLSGDESEALVGALSLIATDTAARGVQASYIFLESFNGPVHYVEGEMIPRSAVGDAPVEEIAGSRDPDVIREPTLTEIVTTSGLRGVLCVRHAPFDEEASHIVTLRATYAFEVEGGFFVLRNATTDLVGFERFREHFSELAATVSEE
ncbi:hypothetical protein [Salinibacterium sp. NK8237]|uniref:hypothetical protein n=1 Tax=Salinibacterium sp. NK8237 TaxID=2792038 RepID=UPI0018CE23BC|nr:hypothetical protein [Salinibacterium sp. NK8237]MBH0129507.1 hypothetical protein [Salinibacterium sp. NK8237]